MEMAEPASETAALLLISWNVAGFRRTHELIKSHYGTLDAFLARHQADIFCVQETRVSRQMLSRRAECLELGAITESYESFWSFNDTKSSGMNGVAVWVKKDLAKGANATQRVLEVDDLDREGRCLMLDLGSLVIFNVYAPFIKKTDESASARKLQFLQLLQKRAQTMRSQGKMVVICGDLNVTWRKADVHENGLYVKVERSNQNGNSPGFCIAGNPEWALDSKVLEMIATKDSGSENLGGAEWIRVGDAVKCLQSDLVLPFAEALKLVTSGVNECQKAIGFPSHRLVRLALSSEKVEFSTSEVANDLSPGDPTAEFSPETGAKTGSILDASGPKSRHLGREIWSLRSSQTATEALEALDATQRSGRILLQFGVETQELAEYASTPHKVNEPESVAEISGWLNDLVDTFAVCHPKAQQRFTFWVQLANMRYHNKGSRLDYILCDQQMQPFLVTESGLAGTTKDCEDDHDQPEAAWNAATNYGRWHGSHQVQKSDGGGLSLQQDDMKLNDSQFRERHTGILYTPPKYSDHVPVCAFFRGLQLPESGSAAQAKWSETRRTQPWTSQATLSSLFAAKRQRTQ